MSSRVAFITLFLGLVAGMQSIDVQTDGAVRLLRISLAGKEVAALTQPPWRALVDFGHELEPRLLEAVGFDERGNEIGHAVQVLNLPRSPAELQIVVQSDKAVPRGADLRWQHLQFKGPRSAKVTFDNKVLKIDRHYHVVFPETDWSRPHLIAAEMRFWGGEIAKREIVLGGAVADTSQSELTPVVVRQTSPLPPSVENCLLLGEKPVRTAAVEKPIALVIFVRDPSPTDARRVVDPTGSMAASYFSRNAMMRAVPLDDDTHMRYLWPIAKKTTDAEHQRASALFDSSVDASASMMGLVWFLTRADSEAIGREPLRLADAVAVAGLRQVAERHRRAVVLLLGNRDDDSLNDPRAVRRYLETIGVPLFVWSLTGPRPNDPWGAIEDVSTSDGLHAAADKLRANLAAQRVAWVDVDPLKALRLHADSRCGMETVAAYGR